MLRNPNGHATFSAPSTFPIVLPETSPLVIAGVAAISAAAGVALAAVWDARRGKVLVAKRPPRVLPPVQPKAVVRELQNEEEIRTTFLGDGTVVGLVYCAKRPGGVAARKLFEQFASDPAAADAEFVAASSAIFAPDSDIHGMCEIVDGVLAPARALPGRREQWDFEEAPGLIFAPAGTVPPQNAPFAFVTAEEAMSLAVGLATGTRTAPPPTKIDYSANVWVPIGTEPPLVTVPVGSFVDLVLDPPNPDQYVEITNTGTKVTGPEPDFAPFFARPVSPEGVTGRGAVSFRAQFADTTVFTAIQGDWRVQAMIRAI